MLKHTEHYFFAYKALPLLLFNRTELLINSFMKSKEKFIELLNILWKTERSYRNLVDGIKTDIENPNFKVYLEKFKEGLYFVIIVLPSPKNPPEATAVGFTFSLDNSIKNRYFTYELDFSEKDSVPIFFISEWDKDQRHINYGYSNSSNLSVFIDKVKQLIIDEKK